MAFVRDEEEGAPHVVGQRLEGRRGAMYVFPEKRQLLGGRGGCGQSGLEPLEGFARVFFSPPRRICAQSICDGEQERTETPGGRDGDRAPAGEQDDEEVLDEVPGALPVAPSPEEPLEVARDEERVVNGLRGRFHFVRHTKDMSAAAVS